jgi:hypothetical protein
MICITYILAYRHGSRCWLRGVTVSRDSGKWQQVLELS